MREQTDRQCNQVICKHKKETNIQYLFPFVFPFLSYQRFIWQGIRYIRHIRQLTNEATNTRYTGSAHIYARMLQAVCSMLWVAARLTGDTMTPDLPSPAPLRRAAITSLLKCFNPTSRMDQFRDRRHETKSEPNA